MDKETITKNILAHHGTKGMKWGVRKSRSSGPSEVTVKTGSSVTGKATVKTKGGKRLPAHPDAIAAKVIKQKLAKSGAHSLSNGEIQQLVSRHNLEQQAARVPTSAHTAVRAAKHIGNFLKSPQGQAGIETAHQAVKNEKVKKAVRVAAAVSR